MSDIPLYANISIQNRENAEIEISGDIPVDAYMPLRAQAVQKLSSTMKLPGFRPGHIPEQVLIQKVGEMAIMEDTAELALSAAYPKILAEHAVDPIGQPHITLTKLAPGNPISFTIKTAIVPDVALPEYTEIAKTILEKKEEVAIEDNEFNGALTHIRQGLQKQREAEEKKAESNAVTPPEAPTEEGGKEKPLPDLTDTFVKTLGDFSDVEDFKTKLKAQMLQEKALRAKDKKRIEIGERISAQADITLPSILIEHELNKMMHQFKGDIKRAGLTFEAYLKEAKKTEEALRKEWEPDAQKRAKLQLVLNAIAGKENIVPNKDEVEKQMKQIIEHNKDVPKENVRIYVETMLTNEEVFRFLEKQI